ncbi:pyridoxal 5'-phosphate synthase glutaminase subunit PdxT [Peribacillus psychrosaccharolyticus]|uniref:Pyridoxal 5'-phosphate synthase subunit PdxT n=1 Tax=Peribacillus psychrosaccharolyticus TaxID=1407 RepID=A0A974NP20_PERPY|nr:pyridoxal 5'-phosphate synthase glutaminase subunit PdxT [Peribacillus psychrosaccharolyticus]MEC2057366.1 pyridoxal 5'-phosphate synthase glutaminase subunit PdxT [Peribacillus psychrosaccharolyticus]MED3742808.1 pyridoxal 5'-phosphate synthase glutaminase subunit PdxT [Peribacillus psychrosaccharolyticus]QQT01118.1 pyridoxal 5'-phosphate synthase glutaminase subunit PdxT [Peribacillus psychrosaccharolyticus]
MAVIGVVALQGAVEEHLKQIINTGSEAIMVKHPRQLKELDGLIIPGGESTAIGKLMAHYGFIEAIKDFSNQQKPIFGTCAGMVLVAKELEGSESAHLKIMDIVVKRNGFGRQIDSFEANIEIEGMKAPFQAVFIRAPYIISAGDQVEILARVDEKIVAARCDHLLVSAFHPELTDDNRFYKMFSEMVESSMVSHSS